MTEPTFVKVRSDDVRPYRFGLWCTVADSEPHANPIVSAKWSEDGRSIWFMLDSHNFYEAQPGEMLELVPLSGLWASYPSGQSCAEQKRPVPAETCGYCGGAGRVPA